MAARGYCVYISFRLRDDKRKRSLVTLIGNYFKEKRNATLRHILSPPLFFFFSCGYTAFKSSARNQQQENSKKKIKKNRTKECELSPVLMRFQYALKEKNDRISVLLPFAKSNKQKRKHKKSIATTIS